MVVDKALPCRVRSDPFSNLVDNYSVGSVGADAAGPEWQTYGHFGGG